ncbi:capsular biosynthesis protein [Sphingopyxis macrogoltabida]|uniref:Capsular biosynthesis protein n=1 Tax=Sphingopyxis macrogoltabida TaxID=33050 RepID=A0A0N9UZ58_SPHMC|nr:capsular biosynthesis protein [Sphingopyxis macrogoltabida]
MYSRFGKRALDILVSASAILVLTPLLVAVALAIKFTDPGPAIFRQRRAGRDGEPFMFYKFRSMPVDTRNLPSDKLGDVQLTPVGSFIRRTNLDELPQLFNILRGEMSLIGPRPSLCTQEELIAARGANGALRLRPGLTGWAQVNSFDFMTIDQKAALDGDYAARISARLDFKILLRTFAYLRKPPPVY